MGRANEVLVVLLILFCKDQPADIGRCQSVQAPLPPAIGSVVEDLRPDDTKRLARRPGNHSE